MNMYKYCLITEKSAHAMTIIMIIGASSLQLFQYRLSYPDPLVNGPGKAHSELITNLSYE